MVETLYFTLGIASVVVTAMAVGTVWAMFKVAKLNSMLDNVYQQFDSTHRDITMVEQTLMNQLNLRSEQANHALQDSLRETNQRFIDLESETDARSSSIESLLDSRADKLENKIQQLGLTTASKQLLKG